MREDAEALRALITVDTEPAGENSPEVDQKPPARRNKTTAVPAGNEGTDRTSELRAKYFGGVGQSPIWDDATLVVNDE